MVNGHISTSSSVYSPIETEYTFKLPTPSEAIIEESDDELYGSDYHGSDSSVHTSQGAGLLHQTIASYVTAYGLNGGLTTGNETLLKTDLSAPLDADLTPRIGAAATYERDLDKTPLIGSYSEGAAPQDNLAPYKEHYSPEQEYIAYPEPENRENMPMGNGSSEFFPGSSPDADVAQKFHRLLMTLLNTGLAVSQESYNFQTSFQLNVQRAKSTSRPTAARTSLYYRKIHLKPKDGDLGSVNTDVSLGSQGSEIHYQRTGQNLAREPQPGFIDGGLNISFPGTSPSGKADEPGRLGPAERSRENTPSRNSVGSSVGNSIRNAGRSPARNSMGILPGSFGVSAGNATVDSAANATSDTTNVTGDSVGVFSADNSADHSEDTYTSAPETSADYTPAVAQGFDDSGSSSYNAEEEDMSVLFIRALHLFDSTESQLESDNSVCLSFEKGDIAFVHTIDDSGWGEVTLVESLDRGWIPMNYFALAVNTSAVGADDDSLVSLQYSQYMSPLLHACGKFLLNPLSHTTRRGKVTFSIRTVNAVRDGVRLLLQETDCLSRSNEIVIKRPVVRKARKTLLSDWYTLMVRANDYKGTANYEKIEILQLLILQVIRRATAFFEVWAKESSEIVKRETELKLQNDMNLYPLLESPPLAKLRVTEINGTLYSYLALIIGRLDLIEHNRVGCDMLETVTHHVILLLRELLFVSKTGSDFSLSKPADLDDSLDALLSLVSELVAGVKGLVLITVNEEDNQLNTSVGDAGGNSYSYTDEGRNLILVASKMIKATGATVASIRKLFETIGDFRLSSERSYPDYARMRIDPDDFIRKCSVGIAKSHALKNNDLRVMKQKNPKSANRYSLFMSGKAGQLAITANGVDRMHQAVLGDPSSAPFSLEFKQYMVNPDNKVSDTFTIKDELLIDATGNFLGASFKGLVYTLTNESSPPEYFFVSTFFICFRSFASSLDLTELFINRFDSHEETSKTNNSDALVEVKIKSRRRLVCKMFQIWMESYWVADTDAQLLSTLVNFFNEGVYPNLPIEAMKLIEISARLLSRDTQSKNDQLVVRSITLAKIKRKNSFMNEGSDSSLSSRYSMVDGYELSRINTNSSVTSSLKSITLPMPLGISGLTSSGCLLTRSQISTIESVVSTYRLILKENWCPPAFLNAKAFSPMSLALLLEKWYTLCEQSWVLSNYRPNLLDFNGLELARQLSLIESDIFCAIRPDELLNGNFTAKKAHLKLAPNVRRSLLFTNCLSDYVLESVLQPDINLKLRVNIVKTWLKVAISCLYLRNFNSLAAIITSLQSHLVTRLTRVWDDLSAKYTELYEYLSGIIHPEKNYLVYRNKLKSFLLSNEYNIPVVPYFSLFLQDLTFVTDGNPNYRKANTFLNQKLINIDKYLKITRIIADIESLQIPYSAPLGFKKRSSTIFKSAPITNSEEYTITGVNSLQELILLELWKISELNRKEEDRAWKLSCLVQPRDTPQVNSFQDS